MANIILLHSTKEKDKLSEMIQDQQRNKTRMCPEIPANLIPEGSNL
jgi:hypothetical protein